MKNYRDFEDYLTKKHHEENPEILDDELPDHFSDWLSDLDPQAVVDYVESYAKIVYAKGRRDVHKEITQAFELIEKGML